MAKRQILSFVLVLAICVCGCAKQVSSASASPSWMVTNQNLRRIMVAVRGGHFSTTDKRYVVQVARSGSLSSRHIAVVVLSAAVEAKLYRQETALALIESGAIKAGPAEARLYTHEYAGTLQIGVVPDGAVSESTRDYLRTNGDASQLTPLDKRVIASLTSSPTAAKSNLAADIIVQKRGLDAQSLRWLAPVISRQQMTNNLKQRAFWEYVERVVRARNGEQLGGM